MLNNFRFLTSGESHGKCLNGIIDGVPSGFSIDIEFIRFDYNIEKATKAIEDSILPNEFANNLRNGH